VRLDTINRPDTFRTLFWMAVVTAGLTAFYTFRAVFMTFTGPTRVPTRPAITPMNRRW